MRGSNNEQLGKQILKICALNLEFSQKTLTPPSLLKFTRHFFQWVILHVFNTENIIILELVMGKVYLILLILRFKIKWKFGSQIDQTWHIHTEGCNELIDELKWFIIRSADIALPWTLGLHLYINELNWRKILSEAHTLSHQHFIINGRAPKCLNHAWMAIFLGL